MASSNSISQRIKNKQIFSEPLKAGTTRSRRHAGMAVHTWTSTDLQHPSPQVPWAPLL